jgi:spore germination protein YaaH
VVAIVVAAVATIGLRMVTTGSSSRTASVAARPEVLGFLVGTAPHADAVLARDASSVNTVAITGLTLADGRGALAGTARADLVRLAHARHARALLVVSNSTGNGFDGSRARATLLAPDARARLVAAVRAAVTSSGADGVVLDLERLTVDVRAAYPALVGQLVRALPGRAVDVTVPAVTWAGDIPGYDVTALARAATRVVWMAYDQHSRAGASGPVGGLPWVQRSLDTALRLAPPGKVLLGIAGYGYRWPRVGAATVETVASAQSAARTPGARTAWDPTQAELVSRLPDGSVVWCSDARSLWTRGRIARQRGLAGVALWQLSTEDPSALPALPRSAGW